MVRLMLNQLLENKDKRFILVGGKGGTGKTSTATALAVKFAQLGEKTLLISTDPAHSIGDSLDQELTTGVPTKVIDAQGELYALEINSQEVGKDMNELIDMAKPDDADLMSDSMATTLSSLGFDEFKDLLDTAPPGIDEAVALAKVIQFLESDEYADYTRIVFDTAPTGHTLRLLSLPDFLDSFIMKSMRIKAKMNNLMSGFKSFFGGEAERDTTAETMDNLKEIINKVGDFFRDQIHTEFVVVTIPTIMAISESERLIHELVKQSISVKNVIINQIMPDNPGCKFCEARVRSQKSSLEYIRNLFSKYEITDVPYFDHEIRGVPALQYMADYLFDTE